MCAAAAHEIIAVSLFSRLQDSGDWNGAAVVIAWVWQEELGRGVGFFFVGTRGREGGARDEPTIGGVTTIPVEI